MCDYLSGISFWDSKTCEEIAIEVSRKSAEIKHVYREDKGCCQDLIDECKQLINMFDTFCV